MNTTRYLVHAAAGLTLALLAGCGGGGGDGGVTPVVYSGSISPAVITTTNASKITTNVIGSTDSSVIVGGASIETSNASGNQGTGPAHLARVLGQDFRAIVVRTDLMRSTQQTVAGAQVDSGPQPCDGGVGTLRIFGTLDDNTGTGTVMFVFSDCLLSGITVNGSGSMQIFVFLTDFKMSFARLTVRGAGLSIDAGGSIRYQEMGNTVTMTLNLDEINNNTGKMRKSANLVIVDVFDNIQFPTTFTQTLTGQVFHSDYGFVNVTTAQPFFFATLAQLFPNTGQMVLTGAPVNAGNYLIQVTALAPPPAALPATMVRLELDLDGNNAFEIDARMLWTQLDGPVGAELKDTDSDGMHNSWETVNGLDPNLNDAAGDKDVDNQTNLQEYMAGTTP